MSTPYVVCVSGIATTTNVTLTIPTITLRRRTYTNVAGCEVDESFKVLTFTCDVASDEDFDIYFSYNIQFEINGVTDGVLYLRSSKVTMPAGETEVSEEVLTYVIEYCPDENPEDFPDIEYGGLV